MIHDTLSAATATSAENSHPIVWGAVGFYNRQRKEEGRPRTWLVFLSLPLFFCYRIVTKNLNESVLLSVPSSPTMRVDETPTILYSSHGGYIPNLLESKNFSQSNFRLVNYMDSMR